MTRLVLRHMEVVYDKEKDCLVYDRKLREGSGSSLYGLEVCKSLNLPEEFLDLAFQIRVKYYPETGGALSLHPSHYNVKKLVGGLCEKCGLERSVEVHHLIHQATADEDGFIGTVHKNHKANLMALCEECHLKQHTSTDKTVEKTVIKKIVKKKTTIGTIPVKIYTGEDLK